MLGNDNNSDIDRYGFAPWLGGLVLFGLIIAGMFMLAAGFA